MAHPALQLIADKLGALLQLRVAAQPRLRRLAAVARADVVSTQVILRQERVIQAVVLRMPLIPPEVLVLVVKATKVEKVIAMVVVVVVAQEAPVRKGAQVLREALDYQVQLLVRQLLMAVAVAVADIMRLLELAETEAAVLVLIHILIVLMEFQELTDLAVVAAELVQTV